MIDLLGFPEPSENVRWYIGSAAVADAGTWEVWNKPRGCTMLSIIAISSGAGGGGGAGNVAGSTAGGGEGGGSSGLARMLFPLWNLPDTLYIFVRAGAAGGTGGSSGNGSAGGNGSSSRVSAWPELSIHNYLISSGAAPTGGAEGTTAAAGTSSGGAGGVGAGTQSSLGQMALTQAYVAGIAGANGGTSGAGQSILPGNGVPILPGCGGGGKTTGTGSAGGGYLAVANTRLPAIPGGVSVSGGVGSPGFYHPTAGYIYGGCGGGGSNTQAGGNGGDCGPTAYGAGGGGGGGGLTTGGRGGRGGPGLVIMACW